MKYVLRSYVVPVFKVLREVTRTYSMLLVDFYIKSLANVFITSIPK
jgi:hypothetical protein